GRSRHGRPRRRLRLRPGQCGGCRSALALALALALSVALADSDALAISDSDALAISDSDTLAVALADAGSRRDRANDDRAVGPEPRHERERRL
ncbi:MAG TPA: hypothetical protein VF302_04365, partial [Candidatus Limnocylindrales bacterium]